MIALAAKAKEKATKHPSQLVLDPHSQLAVTNFETGSQTATKGKERATKHHSLLGLLASSAPSLIPPAPAVSRE